MLMTTDAARDARARRALASCGYTLRKSRQSRYEWAPYFIIEQSMNLCVLDELTIDDVEDLLAS